MSRDLVEFLNVRLDEEAELAGRCDGEGCCGEWMAQGHTVDFCQMELAGFHPAIAQHVATHDPARVLREIEAKRRVLRRHVRHPATGGSERRRGEHDVCRHDGKPWPCEDLLDLVSPFASHPDCPPTSRRARSS